MQLVDEVKDLEPKFPCVRAYTAYLGTGDEVFIAQGIRVRWDAEKKAHFIALGGARSALSDGKSNRRRISIPVFGAVRMKGSKVIAVRIEKVQHHRGVRTKLRQISRSEISKSEGFLLRIDMRSKMNNARGQGSWRVCSGSPQIIGEARVSRRKQDKMSRVECDALVHLMPGDSVIVSPRGEIKIGERDARKNVYPWGKKRGLIPLPRSEDRVPEVLITCDLNGSYSVETLTIAATQQFNRVRGRA